MLGLPLWERATSRFKRECMTGGDHEPQGALMFAVLRFLVTATQPRSCCRPNEVRDPNPGTSCSLDIWQVSIKSFRLLAPVNQIDKLEGIINVHVCECYLVAGNLQKCMLDAVTKAETPQSLTKEQADCSAGRCFLLLPDGNEFVALYLALRSESSAAAFVLASRLLQQAAVAPSPDAPPTCTTATTSTARARKERRCPGGKAPSKL
ncbi:hypothetical protein EAS61_34895 [Bradyrhizobium zhanjiangense]|uniref:Uncharacterized protein n=1 Tax=Bradyrhizobium zhanjiangense TaxID=1325107 RepID=A0A4Q0Q9I7_9BRAD|nr:hypothetical protein EAS61_34895 [Bradyrhizobium zhanjiangense]